MNDQEQKIKELEERLASSEQQLEKMTSEQQDAAKLLIRRDLALSRANEQLQALDEAKSEFISVAAHQLRTPLSAIKWILHMLCTNEFKDDEERLQFIEKAAQSTDRMIGLVNDLLEVDHIQSGKDQFIFAPVDVPALINSVISEFQALADSRNIHVLVDLAPSKKITGDKLKLRALFQNLFENSLKYTPTGGSVHVSSSIDSRFLKVVVTDSGIGIPEDQKIHIFSKFFRASNAMKIETVGSGLGLFIAKQVVERHGGKIWFESKASEGTSFFVQLPVDTQEKVYKI